MDRSGSKQKRIQNVANSPRQSLPDGHGHLDIGSEHLKMKDILLIATYKESLPNFIWIKLLMKTRRRSL